MQMFSVVVCCSTEDVAACHTGGAACCSLWFSRVSVFFNILNFRMCYNEAVWQRRHYKEKPKRRGKEKGLQNVCYIIIRYDLAFVVWLLVLFFALRRN